MIFANRSRLKLLKPLLFIFVWWTAQEVKTISKVDMFIYTEHFVQKDLVIKVQWKKSKPDYYELARLYWVQGLTQHQVANITGVRRTMIAAAAKKFKSLFENGAG